MAARYACARHQAVMVGSRLVASSRSRSAAIRSDSAAIEAAVEAGVSAYVVDGLRKDRVKPIMEMAISRFNAFSRISTELEQTKSALEERKVIDRAKGILMKRKSLSEEEAYALLRATAQNEKKKIAEIAQSIITAAELLK